MSRLTVKNSAGYNLIDMNRDWCDDYCKEQPIETCTSCIIYKAIQKLAEYENKEESEKIGWIPCSERLPEDYIDVLVWFEYYRYGNYNRLYQTKGISYRFQGEWSGFVNGTSGWRDLRIIAWQPLPPDYIE